MRSRITRPKTTLIGVSAIALALSFGAATPALAAPADSADSKEPTARAEVPHLALPEASAPRTRTAQSENDLFSLSSDRLEIDAALGYRGTGTVTVTAKRDIRFGNQGEPSVTPEYGAKFTGVCPPYFGTTIMHAGDQCTLEYYFAPQSHYSLGAGWNMRATPVTPAGVPDGDPVDAQVSINGNPKVLETSQVDAGSVPVGTTSDPIEFRVTNITAFDLPILAINSWGSPVRLADPASLPRTLAPGESANIPVTYSPYSVGEQSGAFLVSAHPPVPDWGTDRPASFIANYSGIGVEVPLTATDADFGNVEPGTATDRTVTVTNPTGRRVLLTAELQGTSGGSELTIGDFDPYLAPGAQVEVPVTWTPADPRSASGELGSIVFTDQWSASSPKNSAVSRLAGSTASVQPPVEPTEPTAPTEPTGPTDPTGPSTPPTTAPATPNGTARPAIVPTTDAAQPLATTGAPELWTPLAAAAGGALLLGGVSLALVARKRRVSDETA